MSRKPVSIAPVVALLVLMAAVIGASLVWTIAGWWSGSSTGFVNPLESIRDGAPWTSTHTAAAVTMGAILVAALVTALIFAVRRGRDRSPADRAAPKMGTGRAIAALLPAALRKRHKRMGISDEFVGVTVGHTVFGRIPLRASYEDTLTGIAGPRRNKSASLVTPNILAAPGSLLVTSVKPDILGDTLSVRVTKGTVSVFDPQRLASAYRGHDCWWNPLAGVKTIEDATMLADVFSSATYGADTGGDSFFPTRGRTLLSRYLFAAAVSGLYLPAVATWLGRVDDPTPITILTEEYPHIAEEIESLQQMTDRTRSGVFSYAQEAVAFLSSESVRHWVQPTDGHPEFDPQRLVVAPSDTLYLFSEEGPGSAGPLIAALTRAVLTAAEITAKREPSGRLQRPFMAILDEAGNICRIPDLPDKYSHYGSRGIIPLTILQSQEQGEEVWGTTGFAKLWSASTVRIFGGGNASNDFLRNLSELIGDYEYGEQSVSTHDGKRSVNRSRKSERIMDVSDLASLSLGRMVVFASGCRPVLVRSIPWWKDKALAKLNATAAAAPTTKDDDAS